MLPHIETVLPSYLTETRLSTIVPIGRDKELRRGVKAFVAAVGLSLCEGEIHPGEPKSNMDGNVEEHGRARKTAEINAKDLALRNEALEALVSSLMKELEEHEARRNRDWNLRNDALESLVNSLMRELEEQESRRSRDRQRRMAADIDPNAGLTSVHAAQNVLLEGSEALMAAHTHTLRSMDMRLAAMSSQLERCAGMLPAPTIGDQCCVPPAPPSVAVLWPQDDDDWAVAMHGGLALDSLPVHMPSGHRAVGGIPTVACRIHGRRAAMSAPAWSCNPGCLRLPWWDSCRGTDVQTDSVAMDAKRSHDGQQFMQMACVGTNAAETGSETPASCAEACSSSGPASTRTKTFPEGNAALPGWEGDSAVDIGAELFESGGSFSTEAALALQRQPSPWSLKQTLNDALSSIATRTPPHSSGRAHRSASIAHHKAALAGSLHASIAKHPLFAAISPGLRREAASACMREVRVRPGTVVAAQGAECDAFVVVSSGMFDGYIAEAGPMPVRHYKRGDSFGDLGLVCSCTHSVTVRCRDAGTLWVLRRNPFQYALLSTCQRRNDSACRALRKVATLATLTDAQIALVASALQEVALLPQATLQRKGQTWDALYIVCAGWLEDRSQSSRKVRVKGLGGSDARPDRRFIRPGDSLGEEALRDAVNLMREHSNSSSIHRRRSKYCDALRGNDTHAKSALRAGSGGAMHWARPEEDSNRDGCKHPATSLRDASEPLDEQLGESGTSIRNHTDCDQLVHADERYSSVATAGGPMPAASVCAGEDGCSLLRLPVVALLEALGESCPQSADIMSRGTTILTKLIEHEPVLGEAFTSPAQRAQLLSVVEMIRPTAGTELQCKGEPWEGMFYVEAGLLHQQASRRSSGRTRPASAGSSPVILTRNGVEVLVSSTATNNSSGIMSIESGKVVGSLASGHSPTSLYAHTGVTAYKLPRQAALVILASTHELVKGVLTPRTVPFHLRRPTPPPPQVGALDVSALLGVGGASKVLLVRRRPKGNAASLAASGAGPAMARAEFALKVLAADTTGRPLCSPSGRHDQRDSIGLHDPGSVDGMAVQQALRESHALAASTHQFIPKFQGAQGRYILMEAIRGCELFYLLREVHRFEPSTAAFYLATVVSALIHLHGHGIVHRDVKPENLVLDSNGYIRLIDYGHCRPLAHLAERAWTMCGTPEYTAPEVLRGVGHGKEVDVWALGVLLFEMLAGYPAFCADEPIQVYSLVLSASPSVPRSFPSSARELISLLLRPQPHARLGSLRGGVVEVACHSFLERIDWMRLHSRCVEAPLIPVVAEASPSQSELKGLQQLLPSLEEGSECKSSAWRCNVSADGR